MWSSMIIPLYLIFIKIFSFDVDLKLILSHYTQMSTWFIWDVAFLCTLNWNLFWDFIKLKINSKCFKVSIPRPILIFMMNMNMIMCIYFTYFEHLALSCIICQKPDAIVLKLKHRNFETLSFYLSRVPPTASSPPPPLNEVHLLPKIREGK